jgi:phosphatidylglycerophosphate synthase
MLTSVVGRPAGAEAVGEPRGSLSARVPNAPWLILLRAAPSWTDWPTPGTLVAGLPLRQRVRVPAQRAGFRVMSLPLPIKAPRSGPQRVVLLADNVVPTSAWLQRLATMSVDPGQIVFTPAAAVFDLFESDPPKAALQSSGSLAAAVEALRGSFRIVPVPTDAAGYFVLTGRQDVAAAEAWLLAGLLKPSEGLMSRHFERRISLAVTRRVAETSIHPNMVTLVSLAIGMLSAPFFVSESARWQTAGALLLLAHSILDGCDGELARLKFLESRGGAALDFWGDNVVHMAVFAAMTVGWSRMADSGWPVLLGGMTLASTLGAAALLASRLNSPRAGDAEPEPIGRWVDDLANRDFIYLILILAMFGRAPWFLVPAAAGIPGFLALTGLALARGRRDRTPRPGWPGGRLSTRPGKPRSPHRNQTDHVVTTEAVVPSSFPVTPAAEVLTIPAITGGSGPGG